MTETLEAQKRAARLAGRDAIKHVGHDAPALSAKICTALTEWPAIADAEMVMAYAALPGEPDLTDAVAALLDRGARVAMPRTDWDVGTMDAVEIRDPGRDLRETARGLREPRGDLGPLDPGEAGVILVPGVAFDLTGGRLGRGKGFYDRFLTRTSASARTVGVCFALQVVERVPMGDADRRVGWIATERGVDPARPLADVEPETDAG